ncbi:MAG: hypothetical protein SFV52_14005 [Saprospiraceae bacterium]|nr:hypothetical protein [Saprospiraceae bacterium]
MNGTFAKRGFQAVLTMFFVFGGLLLTNRAEAQKVVVTNQQAAPQQQQNWLTEQDAKSVLETEMSSLKDQLQNLTPGTPTYNNVYVHLSFFLGIYQDIDAGSTVSQAVAASLAFDDVVMAQVSKSTRDALYDEAVDLLSK